MGERQHGRDLQPGDYALTDFNGGTTRVQIVDRRTDARGFQTGIAYRVFPPLRHGSLDTWYCSGWFEPEPPK
jgi:hypothetical protein